MAQWITRLPTEQKIAGSSPAEIVIVLCCLHIFSYTNLFSNLVVPAGLPGYTNNTVSG